MSDITKIQHHIPRMILKRFSISGNGNNIFFYNSLKVKKIEARNIESVAKEKHLYSVMHKGGIDVSLEKYFASLESSADKILDKIKLFNSTKYEAEEISLIIKFVICLMYRSKRFVRLSSKFSNRDEIKKLLFSTAEEKGFPKETAEKYFSDLINIRGFTYQQTFEHILQDRHVKFIENFDVTIKTCWQSYPKFILQDNYATIVKDDEFNHFTNDKNIWDYPIKIICPISMNVCLVFFPKSKNKGNGTFNFSVNEVTSEQVMDINRIQFVQRDRDVYGSCAFELQRLIDLYS